MAQRKKSKSRRPQKSASGPQHIKIADLTAIPHFTPPVWVDRMEFGVRGDIPIVTMRFLSMISTEHLMECSRIQTSVTHVKQIIDVFCKSLDYYPTKEKLAESAS